ncbi:hypothetical protein BFT35_10565 [Thermoanaerobacterium thermosaccharolyticum]|uniref:DUF2087 domain-containing protein n=1 Tax=Thermoanaerobacterium thermosaccharolyticum TaxID=1517 RepID=UPI000C079A33|nr:DUF2087 domain-containing protein [Thermoanaerobacterium thermosaccharolyticum]PHO06606.1 hypothetical protein BFT35_10565 [Thermoanaerobacterium thermosaccharolyticum]
MKTELVFNLDRLLLNCYRFKRIASNEFKNRKVKIFYAIKANCEEQVISTIFNEGIGAEILSLRELRLIPQHIQVIINGHYKSPELIKASILRGNCIIIIESLKELEIIMSIIKNNPFLKVRIGLRIPANDNSRIGFPLDELTMFCQYIVNERSIIFDTLHFHAGWNVKDSKQISLILKRMNEVHNFIKNKGIEICCWDFGGSFAEPSSFPQQLQKRLQLYHEFLPDEVNEVYFEPGRYLVGDCGRLKTQVVEVRKNEVIISAATYGYLFSGATPRIKYFKKDEKIEDELLLLSKDSKEGIVISGIWPSENDYLCVGCQKINFEVGDIIVFENMGAYFESSLTSITTEEILSYIYEGSLQLLWGKADESEKNLLLKFWCFDKKRFDSFPKKQNERKKLLGLIAKSFIEGKSYPEREVNSILNNYIEDYCTIRRELVDQQFLKRNTGSKVFYERII